MNDDAIGNKAQIYTFKGDTGVRAAAGMTRPWSKRSDNTGAGGVGVNRVLTAGA